MAKIEYSKINGEPFRWKAWYEIHDITDHVESLSRVSQNLHLPIFNQVWASVYRPMYQAIRDELLAGEFDK